MAMAKRFVAPGVRPQERPSTLGSATQDDPALQVQAPGAPAVETPDTQAAQAGPGFGDPQTIDNIKSALGKTASATVPGGVNMSLTPPEAKPAPVPSRFGPPPELAATQLEEKQPSIPQAPPAPSQPPSSSPFMDNVIQPQINDIRDISERFKHGAENIQQLRNQEGTELPVSKMRRFGAVLAGIGTGFMAKNPLAGVQAYQDVAHGPEYRRNALLEPQIKGQEEANKAMMDELAAKKDVLTTMTTLGAPKYESTDMIDPNDPTKMVKGLYDTNALRFGRKPTLTPIEGSTVPAGLPKDISGTVLGADLQKELLADGQSDKAAQVENDKFYRRTRGIDGKIATFTVDRTSPDIVSIQWEKTPQGQFIAHGIDKTTGAEKWTRSDLAAPNWLKDVTVSQGERIEKIRNGDGTESVVKVPVTNTQTRSATVPGAAPAPAGAPQGQPAAGTPAAPPAAPVTVAKGYSAEGEKRNLETGELTPDGQHQLTEVRKTTPLFDQVLNRINTLGLRDDNTPFMNALQRVGYSFGLAADPNSLAHDISNLELAKITGTMPYATASRNYNYLEGIQTHLPNISKDSPQLMFDKLVNARRQMNKYEAATLRTEIKHAKEGQSYHSLADQKTADFYMLAARGDAKKAIADMQEDGYTAMQAGVQLRPPKK